MESARTDAAAEAADEAQQPPPQSYSEDLPGAVADGVAQFIGRPRAR
jgi:hemolysin III